MKLRNTNRFPCNNRVTLLVALLAFLSLLCQSAKSQPLGVNNALENSNPKIKFTSETSHGPVSGTNCIVSVDFTSKKGNLTYVQLTIGETIVKFSSPMVPTWRFYVAYDSTHFSDNQTIPITAFAANDIGGETTTHLSEQMGSPVAYNKGYVVTWQQFNYGFVSHAAVSSRLIEMNHSLTNQNTTGSTTDAQILAGITQSTVFYIDAHGSPTSMIYDAYHPSPEAFVPIGQMTPQSVGQAVSNKSSDQPLYNFVYLDGCDTALAGFPFAAAFGIGLKNQAAVGYTLEVEDSQHNANFANSIFSELEQGETISDAIEDTYSTYRGVHTGSTVLGKPIYKRCVKLYGDLEMKLHGVYGGTDNDWYAAR